MSEEIIKFNSKNGEVQLGVDFEHDTIWATREQIADLFDIDRTGVNRHIRNIYKSEELDENSTYAKIAQVQTEGTRRVSRILDYFNLDMILSVYSLYVNQALPISIITRSLQSSLWLKQSSELFEVWCMKITSAKYPSLMSGRI